MKKLFALLLALSLLFVLAACGGGEQTPDSTPETSATTDTTGETQDNTESTDSTEGTEGTTETTTPETTTPPTTEPDETKPTETTPPETKPAHTHSYSSKITKAATCTEKGVKTFTCSCGKSYTEDIKATGHSYSAKTTQEPTCAVAGIKTFTCSCGDTYTESIPTTAHSHTMKITADATGKDEGTKTYTCSCGDTYTETFKLSTIFKGFVDQLTEKYQNNWGGEEGANEDVRTLCRYVNFTTTDGIHFNVNYKEEYYGDSDTPFQVNDATMKVELQGNNFVVTKWY